MADQKLTALTEDTTPVDADILYLVVDVAGTPASRKVTLANLLASTVKDTGNETVAGVKTFSSDPLIPDEAYAAGWDGVLEPPTKNAVYDALVTNGKGYVNHGATAGTARPAGFASVEWNGSVEPTNWIAGDTWIEP